MIVVVIVLFCCCFENIYKPQLQHKMVWLKQKTISDRNNSLYITIFGCVLKLCMRQLKTTKNITYLYNHTQQFSYAKYEEKKRHRKK